MMGFMFSFTSLPVITYTTPGTASAAFVSMPRMRACAYGLRTTAMCNMPSSWTSATKVPFPAASWRLLSAGTLCPTYFIPGPPVDSWSYLGELPAERPQRRQVVCRKKVVDVRQRRAHALRDGRVALRAEQRVDPDDDARAPTERLHLGPHPVRVALVVAVAHDDRDGRARRPFPDHGAVHRREGRADVRPAGPVPRPGADARERLGHGLVAEQARHLGGARAEDDRARVLEPLLHPEHELEEEGVVGVHRAAHVAEEHDAGLADLPLGARQLDDVHAVAYVPAERAAEVEARTPEGRAPAAARPRGEARDQLPQEPPHLRRLAPPVRDERLVARDVVATPLLGAAEDVGRLVGDLLLLVVGPRLEVELTAD